MVVRDGRRPRPFRGRPLQAPTRRAYHPRHAYEDCSRRPAAAVVAALSVGSGLAAAPAKDQAAATAPPDVRRKGAPIRTVTLPRMDGEHLSMRLVEVTYPPGASSQAHRHPCPVLGYMLSGTMRMQIDDGAPRRSSRRAAPVPSSCRPTSTACR